MKKVFWAVILLGCMLFCSVCGAETFYVNGQNAERVHLRAGSHQNTESLGLFYTGTLAETVTTNTDDQWLRVRIGETEGYMMKKYLQESWLPSKWRVAELKTKTLNMRAYPSKNANIQKVLSSNDKVAVLGHLSNGWYYVQADELTGYVMEEYLTILEEQAAVQLSPACKVGETFDGYTIFSWQAQNGQTLYFTGFQDPVIRFDDVNFDGEADVVIDVIRGASNFFSEFFVWDGTEYKYVRHEGLTSGVCNYSLYPELGIVRSSANNGSAGTEHEYILMRWEGTTLKTVRRAVSEHASETVFLPENAGYTTSIDLQRLRVRVWDYITDIYEGNLVYESLIDMERLWDDSTAEHLFAGEQEALWANLK